MPKIPDVESEKWLRQVCLIERLSVPAVALHSIVDLPHPTSCEFGFGIPRNPRGFCLSKEGTANYMRQPDVVNPFKGKTHTEETKRTISEKSSVPKPYLSGNKNGMAGRFGATILGQSLRRYSPFPIRVAQQKWKLVIREVFKRDGYKCRRCGCGKIKRKWLHAHHIVSWASSKALRFDPTNVVTLCKDCHNWVHSKKNVNNEWKGYRAKNWFRSVLDNDGRKPSQNLQRRRS